MKMTRLMKYPICLMIALAATLHAAAPVELESGFQHPPVTALPHTWWHWMNGNVTRDGVTADLESMKQAGLGGAMIFFLAGPHHQCDTPAGPVDYLSPAWLDLMKHAAAECERLGLEFGMHNCAGWATTGGPWITPELAMQKLVAAEVVIDGGRKVREKLPQPEVTLDFYRDIAVFAIPADLDPGPKLPKWESKAGQRGGPAGRQPDLRPLPVALTGRVIGDGPTTERFLWDIRRTIADLFADHYYGYMAELCHRHGLLFTTEPYTSCFEGMQVGGKADIPMAEFWSNGGYAFSVPLAASIAHTHGPFHTLAFARKLRELVQAGATVLGPRPRHTPSLEGFPESENEVRAIGAEVWGKGDDKEAASNRLGKGRVFTGVPPAGVLAEIGVAPAVQLPADIA